MFKTRKFKVTFPSSEAMFVFDDCLADCIGSKQFFDGACEVIGGFEDGHYEKVYPVKWNKVRDFKYAIGTYNVYADIFRYKWKILGWEKL